MNTLVKKTFSIIILCAVLVVLLEGFFVVHASTETDLSNEVLVFLRDVVKVDMAKYKATLVVGPYKENPSWLGGLTYIHGEFNLTSETSWVEVLFTFVNGTLHTCTADVRTGKLQLSETYPATFKDAVDVFMQRYQTYTNDSNVENMRSMLQDVDLTKNTTTTTDNLKLIATVYSPTRAFFDWHNMVNGAAYSGLNVGFVDGVFNGFFDDRSYMKSAGAPVVVSGEQAVNIALACAANFSYRYGGQDISGFDVVTSQIRSGLLTMGRDNVLVWYPYWTVILPLRSSYPGSISSIVVEIWADTATVIRVYPSGSDIGYPDDPTPTPSASPTSSYSPLPTSSPSQPAAPTQLPSPTVSPSPIMQPTQTTEPFSPQPTESLTFESLSPSVQPSGPASPHSTGRPVETAGFPVIGAVAIVAVAAIICVASAAWFLRKRRT